jgi:DnaJ-class molecular chaperone
MPMKECPSCHGSGLEAGEPFCRRCGGLGQVNEFMRAVSRLWSAFVAAAFR